MRACGRACLDARRRRWHQRDRSETEVSGKTFLLTETDQIAKKCNKYLHFYVFTFNPKESRCFSS